MFAKKFVFSVSTVLLMVLQSTHADSGLLSCEPFSKKGEIAFAINVGISRTIHCPPPDIIGNDALAFCCAEENTGLPICCDFPDYANQNIGVVLGALFGIILLVSLCCCCCCRRRHEIRTVVYPAWLARSRHSTLLEDQA